MAIVTGAGGRGHSIGAAYASGLAAAGAKVVVADRNLVGAEAVADEIGSAAMALEVDIADQDSVEKMVAVATERLGGVDILVNNAALMVEAVGTPLIQTAPADWDRLLSVNLTGALRCARAVVPSMVARGGGRIVNQLSAGAFPAQTSYGVSKVALLGLTTTLATELGRSNIAVNAIAPGMTMSDAGRALTPAESPFVQAAEARVVMRPRGDPDELVGALLLLVSPAGSWITGQVINVDGGFVIRN